MIYMITRKNREFQPLSRRLTETEEELLKIVDQSESDLIQIEQAIKAHADDPKALRKVSLHLAAQLQANLDKMRNTIK